MGINLIIEGSGGIITLNDYDAVGFKFKYITSPSIYAKSYGEEEELIIRCQNEIMSENNSGSLEEIRNWAKRQYDGLDYYRKVTAQFIYLEKKFREIIFKNAFIKIFEDNIDDSTGHGDLELIIAQKLDKRLDIQFI